MPYFKYKNKFCYFEEQGEGKPILFLHGNTASSNMFRDITELFAKNYKVILIDFLGHGKSDRVESLSTDLWHDEALQVITFLENMNYGKVHLIGSSGGALVAINVALERPELIDKVIADSFEGEIPLKEFTKNIIADRAASKLDEGTKAFYHAMHGDDWESVVDNDTLAIYEHAKTNGKFFHKSLETLSTNLLLVGSKEDEYISSIEPDYFSRVYSEMIGKIGRGEIHIFKYGGHPAILSNKSEFRFVAEEFFVNKSHYACRSNIKVYEGSSMVFEFACNQDIDSWMELLELVKDNFPGLDKGAYKEGLQLSITEKKALVAKKNGEVVGALAFSTDSKEIVFLAVHPEYRKMGIAQNLIKKMISLFPTGTQISVITYREDDLQGLAARKLYLNFGFGCGELLTMFEYPCQRLFYIV